MTTRLRRVHVTGGLLAFVFFAGPLAGRVEAYGRREGEWRTRRAVIAPDARVVRPPHRVPVVCVACGEGAANLPDWVVRLGSRLHQAGFEAVPMRSWSPGADKTALAAIVAEVEPAPDGAIRVSPPVDDRAVADVVAQVVARVAPEPGPMRPVRHLFVVRPDTSTGRALHAQASWVVHYAKLDADFIAVEDLSRAPPRWLERYASVVLATDSLTDARRLAGPLDGYVRSGGGLAALARLDEPALWPMFGLARMGDREETVEEVTCDPAWLPGAAGTPFRYGAEWAMTLPEV